MPGRAPAYYSATILLLPAPFPLSGCPVIPVPSQGSNCPTPLPNLPFRQWLSCEMCENDRGQTPFRVPKRVEVTDGEGAWVGTITKEGAMMPFPSSKHGSAQPSTQDACVSCLWLRRRGKTLTLLVNSCMQSGTHSCRQGISTPTGKRYSSAWRESHRGLLWSLPATGQGKRTSR
jgi:hypothetical protein